jgi:thiol:disulfide interchange protein DsbD
MDLTTKYLTSNSMRLALCHLLLMFSACCAAAGPVAETPHVRARLLSDLAAVQPGGEVWLGIEQTIVPAWHTYWKNPGDSGVSTTIAWQLPDGGSVDDVQWPAPGRFSVGPVTSYGYGNEATLLARAHVPETLAPGGQFSVAVTVDWLVCHEECIPEQVRLALTLPVRAANETGGDALLIAAARTKLPQPSPWPARFAESDKTPRAKTLRLFIASPDFLTAPPRAAWFYPDKWGRIDQGGPQSFTVDANGLVLTLPTGEAPERTPLTGVLVLDDANETVSHPTSITLSADYDPAAASDAEDAPAFPAALLMAFLGGILLNLMPCVFPVLSIKALSLLQYSGGKAARAHGLAYLAGVLASFALLAGLVWLLRAGGESLGWGFQFQSPLFVAAMAALMFAVGLNLSGVFEIGGGAAGAGETLAGRGDLVGSFFTGALAVAVATPCTAPFMGAAVAYALSQSAPALLAVFLALGFGLALPYLALSFWPALQRLLPRPGAWMVTLRQALAFPMYGAAIWLLWVLARQRGADAVPRLAGALLLLALAAWLYGRSRLAQKLPRHTATGVALALILAGGITLAPLGDDATAAAPATHWEPYRPERLDALLQDGRPVFVNLTADWCITCLANEKAALDRDEVRAAMRAKNITYLKGDWTNRDEDISALLTRHGRSGVPLYLFYPRGSLGPAQLLPQILTPGLLTQAFSAVPDSGSEPDPEPGTAASSHP